MSLLFRQWHDQPIMAATGFITPRASSFAVRLLANSYLTLLSLNKIPTCVIQRRPGLCVCDRSPPTGIIARHKNDIVCWMTLLLHLAWHVSCDLSCWHYCGIQREDILIVVCFVDLISQWNDKVVVVVLLNVWGENNITCKL